MIRTTIVLSLAPIATFITGGAGAADGTGSAVVQVVTVPDVAAGYTLTAIDCDDQDSTEPSTGDVPVKQAI